MKDFVIFQLETVIENSSLYFTDYEARAVDEWMWIVNPFVSASVRSANLDSLMTILLELSTDFFLQKLSFQEFSY